MCCRVFKFSFQAQTAAALLCFGGTKQSLEILLSHTIHAASHLVLWHVRDGAGRALKKLHPPLRTLMNAEEDASDLPDPSEKLITRSN